MSRKKEKKPVDLFKQIDYNVDIVKNIFKQKEFVVFSTDITEKTTMEKKILRFGGKVIQNPTSNTDYIVTNTNKSIRVKNWIQASKLDENPYGDKDLYHYEFVEQCIENGKIIQPHPRFMFYISKKTRNFLNKNLDNYLNSNTESDNFETFNYSVEIVKRKHSFFDISTNDKIKINNQFEVENVNFLRGYSFYTLNEIAKLKIKLYGGNLTLKVDADFILVKNPRNEKEKSYDWFEKCIELKKIL